MATAEIEVEVLAVDEMLHKYGSVKVTIERIGPDKAREYLERNTKNRRLNERHMKRLCDAMSAGEWWMNGEPIIFGSDGNLLNGQHRLTATIQSGAYSDFMVVRNVDEDAFRTIDGGRIRTTGDVLTIEGEKNANQVAAAIQALVSFVDLNGNVYGSTNAGRKATPILTARVLEAYPQIRHSVHAMNRNNLFRNQHGNMLHMLFSLVSSRLADDFASVLTEGDSDIGRPFVVFRESLVRTPARTELRRSYCAKAIKAFNAELSGERPKMFKFIQGEEFPTIVGLDYERLAELIG
jgi:hypothetical protein